jgi:hypothetical protein
MEGDIFILRKATVQALKGCASLRQAMMHACVLVPKVSPWHLSSPYMHMQMQVLPPPEISHNIAISMHASKCESFTSPVIMHWYTTIANLGSATSAMHNEQLH